MTAASRLDPLSTHLSHTEPEPLPRRVWGIFRTPRLTMRRVAATPQWAGVLLLATVASVLCSSALLETETGRLALVDQWERTSLAFGRDVDDRQYAALVEASRNGWAYAAVTTLVSIPALAILCAAVTYWIFTSMSAGRASFKQVFSVASHASLILAFRQVVSAPMNYARETLASPLTLGAFARGLDETSPIARLLGTIDLFVVWWLVVLGVGMAAAYGYPGKRIVLAYVGAYVALAVVLVVIMAMTGGTA